jgi:hypothetical protein
LLEIIAGRADSIQLEPFGDIGAGVEFVVHRAGRIEVHQVKRQSGTLANWTLKRLESEGVLEAAARHADAGRIFYFVSTVPARELDELSDRARRSNDVKAFIEGQLNGDRLQALFTQLTGVWGESHTAWERLRSTYVVWPDEREVRATCEALAGALLTGTTPRAAVAALSDAAVQRVGVTLDAAAALAAVSEYGVERVTGIGTPAAAEAEALESATDRWIATVEAELLQPQIPRGEASAIVETFEGSVRVVLAVGAAGTGKSGVLHEVASTLGRRNWPVLALRLDRARPVSSARELGQEFGLAESPVSSLACGGQP